jgi:tetratricopeptide (TPR) repeat protein
LNNIGLVKKSQGEYKDVFDYHTKASQKFVKVNGDDHISTADSLNYIGLV